MQKPSLIIKNGKRYVRVGKKLIKVHEGISERELIKWMIKTFMAKKRRKRKSELAEKDKTTIKITPSSIVTQLGDAARISAREAKDQLEAVKKEIKEAQEEAKKLKPPVPPALPPPVRPALPAPVRPASSFPPLPPALPPPPPPPFPGPLDPKYSQAQADAKLKAIQAAQKKVEDLSNEIAAKTLELNTKASADVQQTINNYTVEELYNLKNITKAEYNKAKYKKDILLQELLNDNTINRDLMKKQVISQKYSDEDKEITLLKDERTKAQAELATAMRGNGMAKGRGMSDDDINKVMDPFRPEYLGCIAADEFDSLRTGVMKINRPNWAVLKRVCFVVNTDPRGQPGSHWVCFFIDARPEGTHSVEYYDPLADPIPPSFLRDIKPIVRLLSPDTYLKFRENKIADQHDDSSNCGPFCCRFLQARLKGETFAKASGWDADGEKNIEKWKAHEHQRMWISGQSGEGLRDIYDKVRKSATNIIQRIKDTLGGPRVGPSPALRSWLEKYGDVEIIEITVCKKPIYPILQKILDWLSMGKARENMERLGYDNLMHLYMIIRLKNGMSVKMEKNQIVEIKSFDRKDVGKEYISVPEWAIRGTIRSQLEQAEKAVGVENLWLYDLVKRNCQKFVIWFLGTMSTKKIQDFVEQDIEETLKDMGYIKRAATAITDIAATADVALHGAGESETR